MKNNEIYTPDELELLEQIENGDYVSLPKDELEKEKAFLKQVAINTIEKRKKKKEKKL